MSDHLKPDVRLIREWQLASINHLEDIGSDGAVIKDLPPDGKESLICVAAIMDAEKADAFCKAVAILLNASLDSTMTPIQANEDTEAIH